MPASSLDDAALARLIDCFYTKVQSDPILGPVFNPVVHDWDEHKRLLTSFWCSVALRAGTYRGNPMAAHRPLPIRAEHFAHWLELWSRTCEEVLNHAAATQMIDYAQRIGGSLSLGLGLRPRARPFGIPIVSSE